MVAWCSDELLNVSQQIDLGKLHTRTLYTLPYPAYIVAVSKYGNGLYFLNKLNSKKGYDNAFLTYLPDMI